MTFFTFLCYTHTFDTFVQKPQTSIFLSFSAADVSVCVLFASGVHDGHAAPHPPQTVEKVCVSVNALRSSNDWLTASHLK